MLRKTFLIALVFGLAYTNSFSQQIPQTIQYGNPASLAIPKGYTQLVEIDLGTARMILISGQVAQDSAGNTVGKGDPKLQFEQIFRNLDLAVKSVHGTMQDVVKLTFYLRDIAHLPVVREVRDRYVNLQQPPTSTAVEVSNLFKPDFLAEIEATVIIPKGKE
ncbi:RidA family protein [Dyadobacter chenhuakuii]|uniref:RidA family protein n=1 Tax=Dyadobacter chenhuakuii TaxID=2909339 RepID=A0A9X1Q7M8_9BACT|nr:RidA family protein [Dyadobacter chenhuakuii]MCF2496678.1 RidA family protein [Dyadobacter chenhuakuii]